MIQSPGSTPTSTPTTPSSGASTGSDAVSSPFSDLDAFVALPRMSGLLLSPDGASLVLSVSTPDAKSQRYRSSLWSIDPRGVQPATRLTRGSTGETSAAFTSTGDLLFTAKRADPEAAEPAQERSPLWMLPAGPGEARVLASRAGGFGGVRAAADAPVLVTPAPVLPGAPDLAADDELRKARKDAGVSAILHQAYPVRYWDHDLGPDEPHLLVAALPDGNGIGSDADQGLDLRDLTPAPGAGLVEQGFDISRDGRWVVSSWTRPGPGAAGRTDLVLVEVATGAQQVLRSDLEADLFEPHFSPDGAKVAYLREELSTPMTAVVLSLEVIDIDSRSVVRPAADWDRWPSSVTWLPDGSGLVMTADQDGRGPIFAIPLDGGPVRQITVDDWAYSDVAVAPDGSELFALRGSYRAPAHPVRIPLTGPDAGVAVPLRAPAAPPELPGTLVEVRSSASDGVPVRGWLALPTGASAVTPVPLLLWIHGGPLGSWNTWSWRWTPWILVAAGYAVLLPDPALSTGYGQNFVQRGWGDWGGAPFTDLMAITDEVEQRPEIDATRTAAMGGSFGGYMANWVAGHTDRFKAVVTHASLWALEDFGGTTDAAYYWDREMTPEMMARNSPHRSIGEIRTPMLVIHGDKDYRVPIGQGLRLWYDLLSKSGLPADEHGNSPHRFLYFPSENHWVLTPGHAKVWYEVVLGFLAQYVLGAAPAPLPPLLGGPPARDKSSSAEPGQVAGPAAIPASKAEDGDDGR